jgi:cytochrome c-type protein NapB
MTMKKPIASLTLGLAALCLSGLLSAVEVTSERGLDLTAPSPEPDKLRVEVIQGGIERSYKEQPPMIPHDIEKYDISLRNNGCLKCHSDATYEKEKAKRTPDSHYLDRDGKKLEHLSSRRYFCTQCHAVQQTASPLVENVFQGRK